MAAKTSLLRRLVSDGYFPDEKTAASWVLSGDVRINGRRASPGDKAGRLDTVDVPRLRERYVSRGGLKLEGALDAFGLSPAGLVCIDAGASTGGFTDCLLSRGAGRVYAVDVGFGQLAGSLRQHPAVVNMERTNLSDQKLRNLSPVPVFATCDLSYLSLRKAVPGFLSILREGGDLVCLVKPLFETDDARARRTGVLREDEYGRLLTQLVGELNALSRARVLGVTNSPITGNRGTLEFFLHVGAGRGGEVTDLGVCIAQSVERALLLRAGGDHSA